MADRNERFVVQSITREEIATALNRRLQDREITSLALAADDNRLTSKLCGRYAEEHPIDTANPSYEWSCELLQDEILAELGVPLPDA